MAKRRIAYIQYTNPAGYPCLGHSSRMLAERGWQVVFLGTDAIGASDIRFEDHPGITSRCLPRPAGRLRGRVHFVLYCLWTLWHVLRNRPAWIYASDPFSALPTLIAASVTGARVVYHEHDAPARGSAGLVPVLLRLRNVLARRAAVNVIPSGGRIEHFLADTGAPAKSVAQVWNCPAQRELSTPAATHPGPATWLYYHGSINSQRLPITILDALLKLPREVGLRIVGYETVGSRGYLDEFFARAAALGIEPGRIHRGGTLEQRQEMLDLAARSDVGLMFMPLASPDINMRTMFGASNKAFEYMLCGLPQLVSPLPDWIANVESPGYGVSCDPADAAAIAAAVGALHRDPSLRRRMGGAARQRIIGEWNYESQFAPVLALIER
jgi:glycosyltransferase involved in cell wall biosynthesis